MSTTAVVDGKTPISFAVGFIAGASGMNPAWAAVAVFCFESAVLALDEGVEAVFEKRTPQSYGNQIVDVLVGIAGVYYGEAYKRKRTATPVSVQTQPAPPALPALPAAPSSGGITPSMIAASNQGSEEMSGVHYYR